MDCQSAQERILDLVEEQVATSTDQVLSAHLAECPSCQEFLKIQQQLDLRLESALPRPVLSPEFRQALRREVRKQPHDVWPEWLPDVVHLGSCLAATVACAALLPFPATATLAVGIGTTAVTWVMSVVLRISIDKLEEV